MRMAGTNMVSGTVTFSRKNILYVMSVEQTQ